MKNNLSADEEGYIKGIEFFRKLALAIPALSISLSSACLAFDIYFIKYVYASRPGLDQDDLIVLLPIIAGALFLVAASFSLDWYVDSMSKAELRSLNAMHAETDAEEHEEFSTDHNGFYTRLRLLCSGYLVFSSAISIMMFLLVTSIPIFIQDASAKPIVRLVMITIGFAYSCILWAKMMTTSISSKTWKIVITTVGVATVLYVYCAGKLLQIF